MDKKFTFSDQPMTSKIIYGVVIAILCISAVVVGIVAAGSRKQTVPDNTTPPITTPEDGNTAKPPVEDTTPTPPPAEVTPQEPKLVSPTVGTVTTGHSLTVPVFSDTLKEWRVHTGIDIGTEEGAKIYAAADGKVTAIYTDPLYGVTVEITHTSDFKTVYSNLNETLADSIAVGKTVSSGELIGTVGDTAMCELAKEPHLHFGVKIKDVNVNPLDYITEESKKASLGMTEDAPEA